MKTKYIPCRVVGERAKTSTTHAIRALRAFGLKPVKMPWVDRGGHNRLTFCVTREEADQYLKYRNGESQTPLENTELFTDEPNNLPKSEFCRLEEGQKVKREQEGWTVIPTYKAGVPDLILIRKNNDGYLEIEFEEVKSPTDSIRKEQYLFAEKMKELGIKVTFTWL